MDPEKGLGHTQMLVLRLLLDPVTTAKSAQYLAYDHPGVGGDSAARSALTRLWKRGLVEPVRFDREDHREFALTEKGAEVARALDADPEEDE